MQATRYRPLLLTAILALAFGMGPAAGAPAIPDVSPPPTGAGYLDPWLDARGDTMFGTLRMQGAGIEFESGLLNGTSGLRFATIAVCLQNGTGCPISMTGIPGPAGPAGETGSTGPMGQQGEVGPMGPAGAAGPAGAEGPAGQDGSQGAKGDVGPTGPQGAAGVAGPQGPQGAAGAPGVQGERGPAGATGAQGPAGPQGERGSDGATGATGPAGARGELGPAGVNGTDGAQGPSGPQGERGPAGATGAQGPTGPQGERGSDGPAGVNGTNGAQGPAGPRGAGGRAVVGFANGFNAWNGTVLSWTTMPGRTASFEKTSADTTLEIHYAETLGANRNGARHDSACQFRILLDGQTVLRSWWQADSFSGVAWTRSSSDRTALAFGAAAGTHTVIVQVLSVDSYTKCDAGTGDSGGFLAVYENV